MMPEPRLPLLRLTFVLVTLLGAGHGQSCPHQVLRRHGQGIQISFNPNQDPMPEGGAAFANCQNVQEKFVGIRFAFCTSEGWTPNSLGFCLPKNTCPRTALNTVEGTQLRFVPNEEAIPVGGMAVAICDHGVYFGSQVSFCTVGGWKPPRLGKCREDTVLLIGGEETSKTMEWYNPWFPKQNRVLTTQLKLPRRGHISAILEDGRVMIAGGQNDGGQELKSMEIFDPMEETWSPGPSMSAERHLSASAVLNGAVYVCGGWNGTHTLRSCERYHSGVWENVASLSRPSSHLALVALDAKVYAIGGYDSNLKINLNMVEVYDIQTDSWTTKAPMPTARHAFRAVVIEKNIIACGGYYSGTLNVCEKYDVKANNWTSMGPMKAKRHSLSLLVLDQQLVAVGGQGSYGELATAETYDQEENEWNFLPYNLKQARYLHSEVVF